MEKIYGTIPKTIEFGFTIEKDLVVHRLLLNFDSL